METVFHLSSFAPQLCHDVLTSRKEQMDTMFLGWSALLKCEETSREHCVEIILFLTFKRILLHCWLLWFVARTSREIV